MDIEQDNDFSIYSLNSIINYIRNNLVQILLFVLVFIIIYIVDHISNINAMLMLPNNYIPGINNNTNTRQLSSKTKNRKMSKK